MGQKTEQYFVCDCCRKKRITPVRGGEKGPIRYDAIITKDVGVAGGTIIKWRDLCEDCHEYLAKKASEFWSFQREARAALEEKNDE